MKGVVAGLRQKGCENGGKRVVDEETSFAGGERERAFPNSLSSEEQRFADVLGFEIRIEFENLLCGLAFGDERDDGRDRNSEAAQARHPSHLARIGRDSLELHDAPL